MLYYSVFVWLQVASHNFMIVRHIDKPIYTEFFVIIGNSEKVILGVEMTVRSMTVVAVEG